MEGFGQYIFIVIIIVAFIINAVKEAKKSAAKKEQKPVTQMNSENTQYENEESIEDWEKWFTGDDNNEETVKPEIKQTSFVPVSDFPVETVKKEQPFKPAEEKKVKTNDPERKSPVRLNTREEARRAIIYSEIIKRKY